MDESDSEPHAVLRVAAAGNKGSGAFAGRDIEPRELLLVFDGPPLSRAEIRDFTHVIQVGPETFLGPSGGVDDHVNHSCDPNSILCSHTAGLALVAVRSIRHREEVTFDYSTCIVEEPVLFDCRCGSATCRGVIGPFRELEPALQQRYFRLGAVPEFVTAALEEARPSPRQPGRSAQS